MGSVGGKARLPIKGLVQAAEQMLGERGKHLPGSTRRDWVIQEFKKRFPNADIGELRILVEAAVHRMNQFKIEPPITPPTSEEDLTWFRPGQQN